jgi:hypothetical protein
VLLGNAGGVFASGVREMALGWLGRNHWVNLGPGSNPGRGLRSAGSWEPGTDCGNRLKSLKRRVLQNGRGYEVARTTNGLRRSPLPFCHGAEQSCAGPLGPGAGKRFRLKGHQLLLIEDARQDEGKGRQLGLDGVFDLRAVGSRSQFESMKIRLE